MIIGWLSDGDQGFAGGAERSSEGLIVAAPAWAEIVKCPASKRPPDVDAFIVQNSYGYDRRWIEELELKPVIKGVRDWWREGDPVLRRWLLDNSKLLVFGSQMHLERFEFPIFSGVSCIAVPPPIDLERFRRAAERSKRRSGNIWIGRLGEVKGLGLAMDWAIREGKTLAVHQNNEQRGQVAPGVVFHGPLAYEDIPDRLAQFEQLVYFPSVPEPFCRVVAEAWGAGCKLFLDNQEVGALEWITRHPDLVGEGVRLFWEKVEEVLM